MEQNIIGRKAEVALLKKYLGSPSSELIVVYGRRRVGKTYLVKELFEGQFVFRVTGKENASTKDQLAAFGFTLGQYAGRDVVLSSWEEAFRVLGQYIEQLPAEGAKLLFFDELPWFDTRGSGFLSAFEHFWNDWSFYRHDIKLIVCGSATSWILDKVINGRGGLHNRATHTMLISPFTLAETEQYFQTRGFNYERPEIAECYMAMGGVAYYLSLFDNDLSVTQNIENLCFRRGGEMTREFDRLYKSLFKTSTNHVAIITALHKKGMGMSRAEIAEQTHLPNNGRLTTLLKELEECEFIRSYAPFGRTKKESLFQLIDPFTLFHFRFMGEQSSYLGNYWQKVRATDQYSHWCGYAFEIVCLHHLDQLVHALGIDGTICQPCSWIYRPTIQTMNDEDVDEDLRQGAQIDLLIDRSDKSISVCEIKYTQDEYQIDKRYDAHLQQRMRTFRKVTKTRKTLIPTFITPFGLQDNMYSRRITRSVTLDHLFER